MHMKQIKSSGSSLRTLFIPRTKLHLVMALLLTFFTLFRILCECGWLDETEVYTEFSVTYATWFGVNKTAELRMMNLLVIGTPLFFLGYGFLLNRWQKVCDAMPIAELLPVFFCLLLWTGKYHPSIIYTVCAVSAAAYYLLVCRSASAEVIRQTALTIVLHQYSALIIGQGLYCFIPTRITALLPQILGLTMLCFDLLAVLLARSTTDRAAMGLRHAQVLIPLAFVYAWRFPYIQSDGAVIFRYHSVPLMLVCLAVCAILLTLTIRNLLKKKSGLWLSTALGAAAAMGYCIPTYGILSDWFHYGEYAITAQQLLSYGSLPYFDFYPIHGICDYIYSMTAALFYDGSMAALSAGVVIGNLFSICIAVIVIWCVSTEKAGATLLFLMLLHPNVFSAQGYNYIIRWLAAFLTVCILNSARIRNDAIQSVYWWVWLSMLSILWNPAIGGALAIAFLPVLLRRSLCAEGRAQWASLKEKPVLKKWLIRAVPLLIAGLCYIPVFLHIVQYILENAGSTTSTNGSAMFEVTDLEAASAALPWLRKFAAPLFIALLLLLWCLCKHRSARGNILDSLLLTLCATPLVANYIYVRYDNGDRAIFYWMLLAVCVFIPMIAALMQHTLSTGRKQQLTALGALIMCFVFAVCNMPPMLSPSLRAEANGIPSDVVTINGTEEGIPNLGEGVLPEYKAQIASDYAALCAAVCTDADDSVFNCTTHIGLTVMMDQKLATKYTSLYNISNHRMQENALKQLKADPPKLVLLQHGTLIDEMTTSMRCFPIYEWLLEEGYLPYTYGTLLFMTKEDDLPEDAFLNWQRFFTCMTPEDLQLLPKVWANAEEADSLESLSVSAQLTKSVDLGSSAYCTLTFSDEIVGDQCDFLALSVDGVVDGTQCELSFAYDACDRIGTEKMLFTVSEGEMLVPLSIAPAWYLSDAITEINLCFRTEDTAGFSDDLIVDARLLAYPNA